MPIRKDRLYADVAFLTSLEPPRSYYHPESLRNAAAYIEAEFRKLDCRISHQELYQGFQNVIASFGSENAERIIIGAHYDVCGDQPGADDNASAVAGLLELARALDEEKPELKYRYDFVAYNFEVPPFFATDQMGSAVHAKFLAKEGVKVKLMVCLEMIGYFSEEPNSQGFQNEALKHIYPNTGNFIVLVGKQGQETTVQRAKQLMQETCSVDVQSINAPESLPGVSLSDHRNYWVQGYQAFMINDTAFLRNPHYHQTSDTIDRLDFDKMTEVVKGAYNVILNF